MLFQGDMMIQKKQGRIHGPSVADRWAGAVKQKTASISKKLPTDRPTDRHGKFLSRVSTTNFRKVSNTTIQNFIQNLISDPA